MKALYYLIFPVFIGLITPRFAAADTEMAFQDLEKIRVEALGYLQDLPGFDKSARVTMGTIDTQLRLAACPHLEFSLPGNGNYRGHIRFFLHFFSNFRQFRCALFQLIGAQHNVQ